jgi:hypothetical protein
VFGATLRYRNGISVDAALFCARMDTIEATETGSEPTSPVNPLTFFPTGTFRGIYQPSALILGASVGWTPGARHGA